MMTRLLLFAVVALVTLVQATPPEVSFLSSHSVLVVDESTQEKQTMPLEELISLVGLSPSQFVTTDNTGTKVSGGITNSNGAALSVSSSGQVTASMSQDWGTSGNPSVSSISVNGGNVQFGPSATAGQNIVTLGSSYIVGDQSLYLQPSGSTTVFSVHPGYAQVDATADSSSVTTGALVVDGGVGIAGDMSVCGDAYIIGATSITGVLSMSTAQVNQVTVSGKTSVTGSVTVAGNLYRPAFNTTSLSKTYLTVTGVSRWSGLVTAPSGIYFGSGGTLSIYRVYSWTPLFNFGSSSVSPPTYSSQGTCVQIGSELTCSFAIGLSSKGSNTGLANIRGFAGNQQFQTISMSGGDVAAGLFNYPTGYTQLGLQPSTKQVFITICGSGQSSIDADNTHFNSNTGIWGSFTGWL